MNITAGLLIIGDEILSGRTKDKNIGTMAERLTEVGINVCEVRVVGDDAQAIVSALRALSQAYTYVFTSGGIGPTHDDITADAVAAAFHLSIAEDPRALALLQQRYSPEELNPARRRMARIPEGAGLIANPISKAPGFIVGNVHVMAGVPAILEVMLDDVIPKLQTGCVVHSVSLATGLKEGDLADAFASVASQHPEVSMGSYPFFNGERFDTTLVLRSRDQAALQVAQRDVEAMITLLRTGS